MIVGPSVPYLDACPLGCAAPLAETSIVLPEGSMRRCTACGQLLSACSEERYRGSMSEFDDARGTLPAPGAEKRRFALGRRRLEKIADLLHLPPAQIRLLDVGCSSGAFLRTAAQAGFRAEGVEPAPQAAQAAQAAGLKVHQGLLHEAAFPAESFDAVTLFEVIEHLKEPLLLLRECHRILRPGGVMVIGTGNAASWTARAMQARWEYLHIEKHGGHISFFTPHSLRLAAGRSGFRVERIETRSVRFFEKGDCSPLLYAAAKIAAELLNAAARVSGRGHDMLAFLRRPEG